MSDAWDHVERVTVRRLSGGGYLGEARTHCHFATGEVCSAPGSALYSAARALAAKIVPGWQEDDFEVDL